MPTFQFNPETGQGEEITSANASEDFEASAQQLSDERQAAIFADTARSLAQRQSNTVEVGVANLEAEQKLYQLQNRLMTGAFRNSIEEQVLQQQCEQLAASLVTGAPIQEAPQTAPQAPQKSEGQRYADELANEDPALVEVLNNASEFLENDSIENINSILSSDDPEVVQSVAQAVKQVDSSMISTAQGSATLDHSAVSFFNEFAGEEISNDIQVITAAVHSGAVSRADALATVAKSPRMMQAMLAAASRSDVNFKLAL